MAEKVSPSSSFSSSSFFLTYLAVLGSLHSQIFRKIDQALKKEAIEEPHLQLQPESRGTTVALQGTEEAGLSNASQQVAIRHHLIHLQINRVREMLHLQHSLTSFTQFP